MCACDLCCMHAPREPSGKKRTNILSKQNCFLMAFVSICCFHNSFTSSLSLLVYAMSGESFVSSHYRSCSHIIFEIFIGCFEVSAAACSQVSANTAIKDVVRGLFQSCFLKFPMKTHLKQKPSLLLCLCYCLLRFIVR